MTRYPLHAEADDINFTGSAFDLESGSDTASANSSRFLAALERFNLF